MKKNEKIIKNPRFDGPKWAWKILNEIEKEYNLKLGRMEWKYIRSITKGSFLEDILKKHKNTYGLYLFSNNGMIYIFLSPKKNNKAIHVLLHELSHFIYDKTKLKIETIIYNIINKKYSRREVKEISKSIKLKSHNKDFFKIAYRLYKKYNILNYSINNDFPIVGRKYLIRYSKKENKK